MSMLRAILTGLAFGAVVLTGAGAKALTIVYTQLPNGTNTASVVGEWTATSSPRNFQSKTLDGFSGTGVAGGFVDGEIDLDDEYVEFSFTNPQVLSEIVLAFLFKSGNYGDGVSEVARLRISATPFIAGDLSVITSTSATWSGAGGGAVTNISQGQEPFAGVWSIANPFGTTLVSTLRLAALQVGSPPPGGSANSDFSFVRLATVPEPTTLALLGAGLLGLGTMLRRRPARS